MSRPCCKYLFLVFFLLELPREGIKYALSSESNVSLTDEQVVPDVPSNLLFFEILREFTYRVTKTDRKVV